MERSCSSWSDPDGRPERPLRARDLGAARTTINADRLEIELGAYFDRERLCLRAGLAAIEGRRDEAVAGFRESARAARQLDDPWGLAETLLDAVITLGADDPEVAAFAGEARLIFERSQARALLDRPDEALGTPARAPLARHPRDSETWPKNERSVSSAQDFPSALMAAMPAGRPVPRRSRHRGRRLSIG